VKITVLVEGDTERVFLPSLRDFISRHLAGGKMPSLSVRPYDGRIPKADRLRRIVEDLLTKRPPSDAVIALTDVYTGTSDFKDAADAKAKMTEWVGGNERFYPHVAQYDFEAWLLPY